MTYLVWELVRRGLIKHENQEFQITAEGWEWLETKPKARGDLAFVAMAFAGMDHVRSAIETAITNAGYKPLRIDGHEFVGGIMDEILAKIRDSRFVVADFTRNRGGVYYEAGFALGMGVPLVPLCRRDHLNEKSDDRLHFDVRHLNFLDWDDADLGALTKRLQDRIVALFGRPHPAVPEQ